jgi:DGQHR domain-containing protein
MTETMGLRPVHRMPSMEAAIDAATKAAVGIGIMCPGIVYQQGGRRFVSTVLPVAEVADLVAEPKRKGKDPYDPESDRNRPVDVAHVERIKSYLLEQNDYILAPIVLDSTAELEIYTYQPSEPSATCWFVLPKRWRLQTTDGQHRIAALREVLNHPEGGRFYQYCVGVSIVEEPRTEKTRQDFYDLAQVLKIENAQLVDFDQREPINALTRLIMKEVPVFKDRIQRVGDKIGARSAHMFSSSHVAAFLIMVTTGKERSKSTTPAASYAIGSQQEMWKNRITSILNVFADENPQWRQVRDTPRSSGEIIDMPGLRARYLHFLSAGLYMIGAIGHTVLQECTVGQERLSPTQVDVITRLAKDIDWSKDAPLWKRSIRSGPTGKITASWGIAQVAVADIKCALGMTLSPQEELLLKKADNKISEGS